MIYGHIFNIIGKVIRETCTNNTQNTVNTQSKTQIINEVIKYIKAYDILGKIFLLKLFRNQIYSVPKL